MREKDGRIGSNFELRTAASKNVLARMSSQDLKILSDATKEVAKIGYPEADKRRSVVTKNTFYIEVLPTNKFRSRSQSRYISLSPILTNSKYFLG